MSRKQNQSKTRSITKEVEIDAPVKAVWKALTDAEELIRWWPLDAKVKPGPSGSIWMSWRNQYEFETPIEIWEPNKHLRTLFTPAESGQDSSKSPVQISVDYILESHGNKTILRMVHSGFSADEDWDELFDATHRGWDFCLWGLRHYLENHSGTPRGIVYIRHFIDNFSRAEAWGRLMGRDGLVKEGALDNPQSGDRYAIRTAVGDPLEGNVQTFLPPKDFTATVLNLNNAIMRVQLDELWGRRDVTITLSTYGLAQSEVDSLRENWTKLLDALFE